MRNGQDCLDNSVMSMLCDDKWSNSACCGYAAIACKTLGYSDDQTKRFIEAMNDAFGNYSVENAKEKFERKH